MLYQITRQALRLLKREEGSIFILAAGGIAMLLAGVGLAVDFNRYMKVEAQIQSAIDHAALAAVSVDGQNREEVVRKFFEMNFPVELKQTIELTSVTVTETFPPGGPLTVDVDVDVELTNAFGSFVGVSSITISNHAQAQRQVENVEAVLTLASGGSMCAKKQRIENAEHHVEGDVLIALEPDASCENFNAMKQGAHEFLRAMDENETVATIKLGLVPYNYKVKLPQSGIGVPSVLAANEPEGFYNNLGEAEPLSEILPLTSDVARAVSAIDGLTQTVDGKAWVRSNLATQVAGLMLSPDQHHHFGGDAPSPFGQPDTRKVIILMSDGVSAGCCFTNWPEGNFKNQYVYSYQPDNAQQAQICEELKKGGVQIFSVLFDVKAGDPGGREINNVFARCASGAYEDPEEEEDPNAQLLCSKKQNCYSIADADDLVRVYRDIAQNFYMPRLTE